MDLSFTFGKAVVWYIEYISNIFTFCLFCLISSPLFKGSNMELDIQFLMKTFFNMSLKRTFITIQSKNLCSFVSVGGGV